MSTKNSPGKFDRYTKAMPDEPMFVLLARDPHAPDLVRDWAIERAEAIALGKRPPLDVTMVVEAFECADHMERWRARNVGAWRNQATSDTAPVESA